MRSAIVRRKDFWTGVIYVGVGISALVIAHNYTLGSAARMGPGYFPTVVASLLAIVGALIIARSFLRKGGLIGNLAWLPMLLVFGSIVAFGLLINRAGLLLATVILLLGCAAASDRFRFEWTALLGLVALTAFCAAVFVFGMGIPMPLIGSWFSAAGH